MELDLHGDACRIQRCFLRMETDFLGDACDSAAFLRMELDLFGDACDPG